MLKTNFELADGLGISFRGNYSFLNLEIQRSQYIRSQYINVRVLLEYGYYSREGLIKGNTVHKKTEKRRCSSV